MKQSSDKAFIPYAIVLLAIPAFVLPLFPGTAGWLQYERAAVASGQLWRLLTQHWLHWNTDHLFWDLLTFIGLGIACERRSRKRFLSTIFVAGVGISGALWIMLPGLQTCRGLSGLDSALFGLLITGIFCDQHRKSTPLGGLCICAGTLFVAKTIFELRTGTTLFVDSQQAGMVPVPLCHLIGFIIGALLATRPFFTIFKKTFTFSEKGGLYEHSHRRRSRLYRQLLHGIPARPRPSSRGLRLPGHRASEGRG